MNHRIANPAAPTPVLSRPLSLLHLLTLITALALFVAGPALGAHVGVYKASVQLDPGQVVPLPANAGDALGSCNAILAESNLKLSCTHNVSGATSAHIHLGDRGEAGPVTLDLGEAASPILFEAALTPEQEANLLVGNWYVQVHNPANSMGVIRGQLEMDAQEDTTSLYFSSEDALDGSDAGADCRALVSRRTGDNDLRVVCVHDVADPTSAVLQRREGMGVPVLFTFDDPASPLDMTFTLEDSQANDFLQGEMALDIRTEAFPDGALVAEADGCFADANTLCLNDNRFAVEVQGEAPSGQDPDTFEGFQGRAFERSDTSGEFSFFTADNLEILIKVLDGCSVNNHFWVFFSALTNVQFTVEVTDTQEGVTRAYTNPQGRVARPVTDNAAFMTCPGNVVTESARSFEETVGALTDAIEASPASIVTVIDHGAAAQGAGLTLPPTRLILFGNPALGTPLMQLNRTVGIDLPQKFLVWQAGNTVKVAYNSVEYLRARHDLGDAAALETMRTALRNFAEAATGRTVDDEVTALVGISKNSGLLTVTSPDDVDTTLARLTAAIDASPANVALTLSHDENAQSADLMLPPTDLVVFGNPNLGTPLMQSSRTIGIDLPLKFLVWQAGDGSTRVTYNDIFYLARRHRVRGRTSVLQSIDAALENFATAAVGGGN